MHALRRIALALVIIGAINWGLIGFFQFDLVASIFGGQNAGFSRIIYALVGLSGLLALGLLFTDEDSGRQRRMRQDPSFGTEFGEETDMNRDDL